MSVTECEAEKMTTRAEFEQWYVENAFDYERNPVGSRDCGLQWQSFQAGRESMKLSRIDEECLRIGQQIQRAAKELPDCWNIEIEVERGYGGVTLVTPKMNCLEFNDNVDGISYCIEHAVDAAIKGEVQ